MSYPVFQPGDLARIEQMVRRLEIVAEKTNEALRRAKAALDIADQISRSAEAAQTRKQKTRTRTP